MSKDAVEDIAQEAFMIAYQKFESFDHSKASFNTWICGIVKHLFLNDKRKQARRANLQNQVISDMLLKREATFGEHYKFELSLLEACLSEMDPNAQLLIRERYQNNKKSHNLAEETGRKPAAIRQQLVRLRAILRKCVGDKL